MRQRVFPAALIGVLVMFNETWEQHVTQLKGVLRRRIDANLTT